MSESLRPPGKDPAPRRSRLRQWLRLGPSKAEMLDAIEAWRTRRARSEDERNEAQARAKQLRRDLHELREASQREAKQLRQQLAAALEDGDARVARIRAMLDALLNQEEPDGVCTKVQFHRQPEANDWLLAIAAAGDAPPEVYKTYECKVCPRSPVTIRKFWHVGHRDNAAARAAAAAGKARRSAEITASIRAGTSLKQRIDPDVLAKLQAIRNSSPAEQGENRS